MIDRYTRPEMALVWDLETKFGKMMDVEIAVAAVQAGKGMIPKSAARDIRKKARFSVKRILEIEKITKHDVIAFVSNMAENIGPAGRYVHYGMTSSDVLDTAFSLQVREAGEVLLESIERLKKNLRAQSRRHAETLCPGRTHGMFAEPTTFGLKMSGFFAELERNEARVRHALKQMEICKLSGAVGTYSAQPPEIEKRVAQILKLTPETVATQVVPRDRHAEMIWALSMLMAGLERLSVELRHLQRSEVSEVIEGFTKGQKGSSAMPHKKNPISAENITGLSRLVRGYAVAASENIPLWHERDISHSSVERVIFPDAFIVTDYAVSRMATLVDGLDVDAKRMMENIELSQGQLFSSHVLLALVDKGLSREEAYAHVQRLCHSLGKGDQLSQRMLDDEVVGEYFTAKEVNDIFSGKKHKKSIKQLVGRVL